MSEGTFKLRVFSGRGLEVEATVSAATVPSEVGELGFLQDHCDYVGLIATGIAYFTDVADGSTKRCIVSGGICTFSANVLTLLADTVDLPETLDRAQFGEDLSLLETELAALSTFDPEWQILSQKVARINAVRSLEH